MIADSLIGDRSVGAAMTSPLTMSASGALRWDAVTRPIFPAPAALNVTATPKPTEHLTVDIEDPRTLTSAQLSGNTEEKWR